MHACMHGRVGIHESPTPKLWLINFGYGGFNSLIFRTLACIACTAMHGLLFIATGMGKGLYVGSINKLRTTCDFAKIMHWCALIDLYLRLQMKYSFSLICHVARFHKIWLKFHGTIITIGRWLPSLEKDCLCSTSLCTKPKHTSHKQYIYIEREIDSHIDMILNLLWSNIIELRMARKQINEGNDDLESIIFSWSVDDVFNEGLFKGKVWLSSLFFHIYMPLLACIFSFKLGQLNVNLSSSAVLLLIWE